MMGPRIDWTSASLLALLVMKLSSLRGIFDDENRGKGNIWRGPMWVKEGRGVIGGLLCGYCICVFWETTFSTT